MAAPVIVPIDQRFSQLIQQFGLTKNAFAMSLGKTASVVQHLIDGRNKPGYDLLCRIFEIYPNVSRDWLLLGRGPMLIGGELPPRGVAPVAVAAPEQPVSLPGFEDIEVPPARRSGPGVAGTRLQPAEIAATLALAAAANVPVRTAAPAPSNAASVPAEASSLVTESTPETVTPPHTMPSSPPPRVAAMSPATPPATAPASVLGPGMVPVAAPAPETYVAAALHAQHLQHQLALAELRNHHLLEQQQMLREMLAMARQANI